MILLRLCNIQQPPFRKLYYIDSKSLIIRFYFSYTRWVKRSQANEYEQRWGCAHPEENHRVGHRNIRPVFCYQ